MATVTEPQVEEKPFMLPDYLEVGQRVLVSTDPHFASPAAGMIAGMEAQGAWIFLIGGNTSQGPRMLMLEDCWYDGDPRIKRQPHLISEAELRGVFRLADSEMRTRTYAEQFRVLEAGLEKLLATNSEMEAKIKLIDQLEARVKKLELAKGK